MIKSHLPHLLVAGLLVTPPIAACKDAPPPADSASEPQAAPASGAKEEAAAEAAPPGLKKRARAVLGPFKKSLKGALVGAMEAGGPIAAIEACRLKAPELAKAAAKEGITVGRTSHKLRNPANAPKAWHKEILDRWREQPRDDKRHTLAPLGEGRWGYAEAIYLQPLCLGCHGPTEGLGPELREALAEHYPDDRATGLSEGELRGIFWVELPAAAASGGSTQP